MIISYRFSLRRRRPPGRAWLTAPKAPFSPNGSGSVHMVAVPVHMVAVPWRERPFFLRGAFGARLRRRPSARPSATISHRLCNYRRPGAELESFKAFASNLTGANIESTTLDTKTFLKKAPSLVLTSTRTRACGYIGPSRVSRP